jgi:hypothetical protein
MLSLAIAGLITLSTAYKYYYSQPKQLITFMDRSSLQQFFKDDPDRYFHNLNQINLMARGYETVDQLIGDAVRSADEFSTREQNYLLEKCKLADDFLQKFDSIPYFPSKKVVSIKWILAKCIGQLYEKGSSHTRLSIIFLYENNIFASDIVKRLVHEKVHLFSRLFPNDMKRWIDKNGYTVYKTLEDYPLARHNPDIDNIVYKDKHRNTLVVEFRSKFPESFRDVIYPVSRSTCLNKHGDYLYIECIMYQHPNETLAYLVENYVKI